MNVTKMFEAKKDAHAKAVGPFVIEGEALYMGDARQVWDTIRALGGRQFRIIYECKDGTIRDMTGRQGVWKSAQDGMVQGVGHAMESEARLTLSFHTHTHGGKVNTGAGKGYRTIRAAGVLAIKVNGVVYLTRKFLEMLGR